MQPMKQWTAALALCLASAIPVVASAQALRLQAAPAPMAVASVSPAPTAALAAKGAGTLMIMRKADGSSERLRQAYRSGATLDSLVLGVPPTRTQPYLEMRLYSVKVTSYSVNGSGLDDGSIPTETLSLNFDRITW